MRIDSWLVQNGYFPSRQRARMAIEAGTVFCNGNLVAKASFSVQPADVVEVMGDPLRYVSRGGLKLEKAIRVFQLDFQGKTVLDAGASTGGFTDCALLHGAAKVVAVDIGQGQLATSLRSHPKVVFYENLDVRKLEPEHLHGQKTDVIVADLSFISLTHVLPSLSPLLAPAGCVVLLVKPQFEMESRLPVKGGIVKDPALWEKAVRRVVNCAESLGFRVRGLTETDVEAGGRKNVEFLLCLERGQ